MKPFPATHWTMIRDAREPASPSARRSMEQLAAIYWRPVYAYYRRKWGKSNEEAKDLTQEFFLALANEDFLKNASPEKGRFRSYVMGALDNIARVRHRHDSRQKRGGGSIPLSLDLGEGFDPAADGTPEQAFLRTWISAVLDDALREMEEEYRSAGMETSFRLFLLRDVDPPFDADLGYEALALRFGIAVTDVTNFLFRARKRMRELVMKRVRDTVTTDEEVEKEMRELFEGPAP